MTNGPVAARAAELRALGIDHDLAPSDRDLVEAVAVLESLGVTLEAMVGQDLTLLGGPAMVRPDATHEPNAGPIDFADDFTRQIVLALGFHYGEDRLGLTPAEADALAFFASLRELVPDDEVLALLRVVGTATAGISRSVISLMRLNYEQPIIEGSGSIADITRTYLTLTDKLFEPFLAGLSATLRRHMARLSGERSNWEVDRSHSYTHEQATIGFVDLVGFTDFTEQSDPADFINAVKRFELQVNELIVGHGGILVKLIGDEAMFATVEAETAVEIATGLGSLRVDGSPDVRVGMASGRVTTAGGDYYGTVVNLASRAVEIAKPGTVVVTAATAAACVDCFESIGDHQLHGIAEPVELFQMKLGAQPPR